MPVVAGMLVLAASAPGAHAIVDDETPPTVTFDNTEGQIVMAPPVGQDRITGTVSDGGGIKSIQMWAIWRAHDVPDVPVVSISQPHQTSLNCNGDRTACTWSATVPNFVPGYWQITAVALDYGKNENNAKGPHVLVVVPTMA